MQNSNNLMDASHQWATRPADQRFQTMADLTAAVEARRKRCRSLDLDTDGMNAKLLDDGTLTINGKTTPCEPSHWAFGQLGSLIKAPASYLRTLPPPLVVDCLNYGLKNSGRETVKFMTITEDDKPANTLQAVTSTTYGRIWDADCVAAVARVQERSGGKFHNPLAYNIHGGGAPVPSGLYASDHDCFMFMIDGGSVLEAGPRAELNRGFLCWNSETGAKTFGLMTFLFNRICGNHIIWGASEVNKMIIRHTSGGPYRFDAQAAPQLLAYANQSAKPELDAVRRAQDYRLPGRKVEEITAWVLTHGKFSRSEIASAIDFAKSEEGDCLTLWHLVQGFTAYARGFDFVDTRVDLEARAGKLLNIVSGV